MSANSVFVARPSAGFGHWVPGEACDLSGLEVTTPQTWVPQPMRFDDTAGPMPDLARIEGVEGSMVIRNDDEANYGVQYFCSVAAGGYLFSLSGEAEGYAIFRPTVWKAIDVAASAGLEDVEPTSYAFRPDRIGEGLFRSVPRIGEIYCSHVDESHPITDLDDVVNMQFMTWYELASITGFDFEAIWQS